MASVSSRHSRKFTHLTVTQCGLPLQTVMDVFVACAPRPVAFAVVVEEHHRDGTPHRHIAVRWRDDDPPSDNQLLKLRKNLELEFIRIMGRACHVEATSHNSLLVLLRYVMYCGEAHVDVFHSGDPEYPAPHDRETWDAEVRWKVPADVLTLFITYRDVVNALQGQMQPPGDERVPRDDFRLAALREISNSVRAGQERTLAKVEREAAAKNALVPTRAVARARTDSKAIVDQLTRDYILYGYRQLTLEEILALGLQRANAWGQTMRLIDAQREYIPSPVIIALHGRGAVPYHALSPGFAGRPTLWAAFIEIGRQFFFRRNRKPHVLLVGPTRSGKTLLLEGISSIPGMATGRYQQHERFPYALYLENQHWFVIDDHRGINSTAFNAFTSGGTSALTVPGNGSPNGLEKHRDIPVVISSNETNPFNYAGAGDDGVAATHARYLRFVVRPEETSDPVADWRWDSARMCATWLADPDNQSFIPPDSDLAPYAYQFPFAKRDVGYPHPAATPSSSFQSNPSISALIMPSMETDPLTEAAAFLPSQDFDAGPAMVDDEERIAETPESAITYIPDTPDDVVASTEDVPLSPVYATPVSLIVPSSEPGKVVPRKARPSASPYARASVRDKVSSPQSAPERILADVVDATPPAIATPLSTEAESPVFGNFDDVIDESTPPAQRTVPVNLHPKESSAGGPRRSKHRTPAQNARLQSLSPQLDDDDDDVSLPFRRPRPIDDHDSADEELVLGRWVPKRQRSFPDGPIPPLLLPTQLSIPAPMDVPAMVDTQSDSVATTPMMSEESALPPPLDDSMSETSQLPPPPDDDADLPASAAMESDDESPSDSADMSVESPAPRATLIMPRRGTSQRIEAPPGHVAVRRPGGKIVPKRFEKFSKYIPDTPPPRPPKKTKPRNRRLDKK